MTGAGSGPLRVIVVDDEAMAVDRMELLLSRIDGVETVGSASDGETALDLLRRVPADVLLLDISMPGLTGLDVAETLQGQSPCPAVIFVTAFDQHAVRAFELAATDYLLKPVGIDRLHRAMERARERRPADPDTRSRYLTEFWVPHRGEMVHLDAAHIDHIEAERDYMRLHTATGSLLLHETIKTLEERLDPGEFIRTHRSHIFRRKAIERVAHEGFGVWHVELADGEQYRIGRTYLPNVKAMLDGHD